jgi:hypothetical protein
MGGRHYTRVDYSAGASLWYEDHTVSCRIDNLSLRGMYLQTDLNLPLDAPVRVTVNQPQKSFINARVVRKEANGVALQINSMSANTFAYLRDIVAEKSCDSEKVIEETYTMLKCIY